MMETTALAMALVGFASGSMMFSAWLVRLRRRDIRRFGDANPGAMNAFRAGGWTIGLPALLLDFLKGALPVAAGRWALGITGAWLVPVAVAPVIGHAFSPWVGFRGGKAVAVTFGAWCGLTLWEGPTVLGLGLALSCLWPARDAWRVMAGMLLLLLWWLLRGAEAHLFAIWAGHFVVLAVKHRRDLAPGFLSGGGSRGGP